MINLHENIVAGRDQTRHPWIYSQTRTCSQARYRLRYAVRYNSFMTLQFVRVSSGYCMKLFQNLVVDMCTAFARMMYNLFLQEAVDTTSLNLNCLDQFCEISWNQTTDVHQGSTLITRVIT